MDVDSVLAALHPPQNTLSDLLRSEDASDLLDPAWGLAAQYVIAEASS